MKDIKVRFKKLESLLNALITEHQLLRKENQKLREELAQWQEADAFKEKELQKLRGELNNAKLAQGLQSGGEDAELTKAKLGSLMREIDRCIASLNE